MKKHNEDKNMIITTEDFKNIKELKTIPNKIDFSIEEALIEKYIFKFVIPSFRKQPHPNCFIHEDEEYDIEVFSWKKSINRLEKKEIISAYISIDSESEGSFLYIEFDIFYKIQEDESSQGYHVSQIRAGDEFFFRSFEEKLMGFSGFID